MKKIILLVLLLVFCFSLNDAYALNLSRVKTWSASEVLTAADLNAEFDNVLDHEIANADISATAAIVASKIDFTVSSAIGSTTPSTGAFTTLSSTGDTTIGNASGDALTFHPNAWTLTNNVTITGTWTDLSTVTTVDINGGTLDGVQIGGTTATGELIVNDSSDAADGLGDQGTSGEFLQSAGSGSDPIFTKVDLADTNDVTGTLGTGNGGTGRTTAMQATGSYSGSTSGQSIAHGLGRDPVFVYIVETGGLEAESVWVEGETQWTYNGSTKVAGDVDATNLVFDAQSTGNTNGRTYKFFCR